MSCGAFLPGKFQLVLNLNEFQKKLKTFNLLKLKAGCKCDYSQSYIVFL